MITHLPRRFDKEDESQLLLPGAVLPEQFFSSPSAPYTNRPEVALMRAVLEDAIAFSSPVYYSLKTQSVSCTRG